MVTTLVLMDAPFDDVVGRMAKLVELFEEGGDAEVDTNVKFRYDTNVSNVSNVTHVLLFDVEVYLGLKRMLGI